MALPTLINKATNPSAEVDLSNAGSNMTLTRSSAWSAPEDPTGLWSFQIAPTGSSSDSYMTLGGDVGGMRLGMEAGKTYTLSATIQTPVAQVGTLSARARQITLWWKVGTGSYQIASSAAGPVTGSARLSVTASLPVGTTEAFVRFYNGSQTVGDFVRWDAIDVHEGDAARTYFDGDFPDDAQYTYAWSGAANTSTSVATPQPSIEATLFPSTSRASVTLDWSNSTPVPATAVVERVHEDGTRLPVRGADPAGLIAGVWVGDDFEVPHDEQFYYVATSTDVPGVTITSTTYTIASDGLTWLKHPGRPALNTTVQVTMPPDLSRPVEQGVFDVLGRSRPVALSMRRQSERGELRLFTDTEAARTGLAALVEDGSVLLLATPAGHGIGTVYISVAEVTEQRISRLGREPARYWSLPFTVVDRPQGIALAAGNSWSDVLGAYPSWSQLLQTEGTWADVLEGVGD